MCLTALFDGSTGCRVQTHEISAPRTSLASHTSRGICFVGLFIFERVLDKGSKGSESVCLHVPRPVSYTPHPGQGGAKLAHAAGGLLHQCVLPEHMYKSCFTRCPSEVMGRTRVGVCLQCQNSEGQRQEDQEFNHL